MEISGIYSEIYWKFPKNNETFPKTMEFFQKQWISSEKHKNYSEEFPIIEKNLRNSNEDSLELFQRTDIFSKRRKIYSINAIKPE
jgi:hypothetical protein